MDGATAWISIATFPSSGEPAGPAITRATSMLGLVNTRQQAVNRFREIYRGPHPLSEPEARGLANFLLSNRDDIGVYVALHAYGNEILYPWGFKKGATPSDVDDLVSRRNEEASHYLTRLDRASKGSCSSNRSGQRQQVQRQKLGRSL